ncbi:hypothetical protein GGTG_08771 [Gaeumannomyces tritici R3-111a-1]|uniref:Phosphatidylethanolamine-binding protein n=1 Tax=Gaeumannomyces tritici (strain R3-111a-1) TaxID=644352 RepID=J3P5I2_GAET3|nr:hypothetical protein GGTG_08771 [Gaeumannomyces tritici R3-111a-1]EJT74933.1 hypothetical protein GGTG_08771 [Gaeumannomyces tritici R3-111a-1]
MPFDAQAVVDSISRAGLAPGATPLIPADFEPTTELSVVYGGAKPSRWATSSGPASSGAATYTLLLVDPDAPYPDDTQFANWRHWVVTGLRPTTGASAAGDAAAAGVTLTAYLGPGPKDDSEPHRYLFQLFKEPEGGLGALTKADVGGEEFVDRRSFDSPAWAARHGLELVALNWMLCAADAWEQK